MNALIAAPQAEGLVYQKTNQQIGRDADPLLCRRTAAGRLSEYASSIAKVNSDKYAMKPGDAGVVGHGAHGVDVNEAS